MPGYRDLTPYEYIPATIPEGVRAVNIGWLGAEYRDFPKSDVPAEFVTSLAELCRDEARNRMRGWQECRFKHNGERAEYPVTIDVGGTEICLGGAEVRVIAPDGIWMIAPDLIYDYVTVHSYQPPAEFIEAVMAHRIAPKSSWSRSAQTPNPVSG